MDDECILFYIIILFTLLLTIIRGVSIVPNDFVKRRKLLLYSSRTVRTYMIHMNQRYTETL